MVLGLLDRYDHVVGYDEFDLGETDAVTHSIDVQGAAPVKQPYRRFPDPLRREIQREVDKLLEKGILEESSSPWASPMVPVRKRN